MKEYVWLVEYSLLDLLKYYMFLRLVFDIRIKKDVMMPVWMFASIICCLVYYNVCGFDRYFYIMPNICSLFLIALVHKKSRLKSVLFIVLSWIILDTFSETIRLGIFSLTGNGKILYGTAIGNTLVPKCMVLIIPFFYHVVVNIILKKKIEYSFFSYQWGLILISFLGCFIIISSLKDSYIEKNLDRYELVETSLFMIIFFFLFVMVMVWQSYVMKRSMAMKENESKYIYMLKAQEKYFEELRRRDEDIRKFRHDTRAHMAVVRKYIEQNKYEQILKFLSDIENQIGVNEKRRYTGNVAVDAVIYDQIRIMAEKNIEFSFDGVSCIREEISDFDLCTIFYNIIRNAVDGCEKVEFGCRHIDVKIKNIGEKLGIIVENNTVLKMLSEDGVISTSKDDKQKHGLEMKSVKAVINKYNGVYSNSIKDGKYVVNIVI